MCGYVYECLRHTGDLSFCAVELVVRFSPSYSLVFRPWQQAGQNVMTRTTTFIQSLHNRLLHNHLSTKEYRSLIYTDPLMFTKVPVYLGNLCTIPTNQIHIFLRLALLPCQHFPYTSKTASTIQILLFAAMATVHGRRPGSTPKR